MKIQIKALLLASLLASSAQAAGINAQTFSPSVSEHYVFTEDGFNTPWPKYSRFYLGANYNYVNDPLVAVSTGTNTRAFNIINSIQTLDLMMGWKLSSAVGLFFGIPIHQVAFQNNPGSTYPNGNFTTIGDFKILGKLRLTEAGKDTSLALAPELRFATGNQAYYISDASTYLGLKLVLESKLSDSLQIAANLGFAYAQNAILNDSNTANVIDYRNRVPVGVGLFYKFNDTWGSNLEYSNTLFFPTEQQQNPNDFYAGLRCQAEDNLVLTLGGSLGKVSGPTGQNYRIITGVRFAPFDQEPKATPAPAMTPWPTPEPTPQATPMPTPHAVKAKPRAQEKLVITLDISSLPFEFDSARLPKFYGDRVREIGRFLGTHKATWHDLSVQGNTDERGSNKYNDKLSNERAHMVKQLLMEGGAPPAKIKSIGFGKRRPLDHRHNEKGWAMNRRVDLVFRGVKDVVLIREGIDEQRRMKNSTAD